MMLATRTSSARLVMARRVASRVAAELDLLPVMDPLYNLRECCKQMILLEDHLVQPRKRCIDCITKHFLTIEGLFEEAASLDHEDKWTAYIEGNADRMRALLGYVLDGPDALDGDACVSAAHGIRLLRKAIMPATRGLKLAFRG